MRLTDDRYSQERHRMEVALRMIRLEARTFTIRSCTGLTEDRIRKLFNSYIGPGCEGSIRRRRGKSPQQTGCFTQSASVQLSTSILAGVFASSGLLDSQFYRYAARASLGATMCEIYEFYRTLDDDPLSFEHAWFLLKTLHDSDDLVIANCHRCASLYVRDRWAMRWDTCPLCRLQGVRFRSPANQKVKAPRPPIHFAA